MDYYEIKNTERNYNTQISIVSEAEWTFVETLIHENYDKAEIDVVRDPLLGHYVHIT